MNNVLRVAVLNFLLKAVEFVTEQHDDELWDEFIKQCLQKGEMVFILSYMFVFLFHSLSFCSDQPLRVYTAQVGMLLEHTVGNLDPLYIVSMVPDGLEIPRQENNI